MNINEALVLIVLVCLIFGVFLVTKLSQNVCI
jgi:hypothetical protein